MEFSLVFPTATPTSHGTTTGPANYNWEGLKDTILGDTDPGDCFCQISPSVQQILACATHMAPMWHPKIWTKKKTAELMQPSIMAASPVIEKKTRP